VQNDQQTFYDLLKNADVRETDGIRSELHLNQDGEDLKVELQESELYIRDDNSGLKIYVPRNEEAQYLCFVDKLPKGLLEWMMTEPLTQISEKASDKALYVTHKVVTSRKYFPRMLDTDGIVSVEMPNDHDLNELPGASTAAIVPTTPTRAVNRSISVPFTPGGNDIDGDFLLVRTPASSASGVSVSRTSFDNATRISPSRPAVDSIDQIRVGPSLTEPRSHASPLNNQVYMHEGPDPQYLSLLNKTIAAARRTTFPSRGAFDMSAISSSLVEDVVSYGNAGGSFRSRSYSQLGRDKRIGAAGELFVSNCQVHHGNISGNRRNRYSRYYLTWNPVSQALLAETGRALSASMSPFTRSTSIWTPGTEGKRQILHMTTVAAC
jgi:hypothetical protein